jgi:hypothetical protein
LIFTFFSDETDVRVASEEADCYILTFSMRDRDSLFNIVPVYC